MSERANEVKTEDVEIPFAQLNYSADTLDYLQALSAERLLEQIKQIKHPIQIIAIYAQGSTHFAWVRVQGKIKKVQKKGK